MNKSFTPRLQEQPGSAGSVFTISYHAWKIAFFLIVWSVFSFSRIFWGHLSGKDLTGSFLCGLVTLLVAAVAYERERFVLNKNTQEISWKRWRAWGAKSGDLPFSDVQEVFLEQNIGGDTKSTSFRVVLKCRDYELPITSGYFSQNHDALQSFSNELSKLILNKAETHVRPGVSLEAFENHVKGAQGTDHQDDCNKTPTREDNTVAAASVAQPKQTRVEIARGSNGDLCFNIPRKGVTFYNTFFVIFWDAVLTCAAILFSNALLKELAAGGGAKLFSLLIFVFLIFSIFFAVTLLLNYALLDLTFGKSLLYLNAERVRFHHELLGWRKKNTDLDPTTIQSVGLVILSQKNLQNSYEIKIKASDQEIRFGAGDLTTEEQRWICAEIYQFLKAIVPALEPPGISI